jgi:hypothetical protein
LKSAAPWCATGEAGVPAAWCGDRALTDGAAGPAAQ